MQTPSRNLFTYLLLYIYGYILAGDIRFKATIQAHRQVALITGIVTLAILYYWSVKIGRPPTGYTISYLIFTTARCLNSWCLLIAILGYGSRYLSSNKTFLKYVTQHSLAVTDTIKWARIPLPCHLCELTGLSGHGEN